MKIKCESFECEVCGKVSTIQVFYNKSEELKYGSGELKYGRARHYLGREYGKPQFEYHKQTLEYLQRKLNQIPKDVNHQIVGQLGQLVNDDLKETQSGTILKSSWASSSVRIEHQP